MLNQPRDQRELFRALGAQERVGVVRGRVHVGSETCYGAEGFSAEGAGVGDGDGREVDGEVGNFSRSGARSGCEGSLTDLGLSSTQRRPWDQGPQD